MEKKYYISCAVCRSTVDLEMFAHRAEDGSMVGWIFVCEKCTHLVKNAAITMAVTTTGTTRVEGGS